MPAIQNQVVQPINIIRKQSGNAPTALGSSACRRKRQRRPIACATTSGLYSSLDSIAPLVACPASRSNRTTQVEQGHTVSPSFVSARHIPVNTQHTRQKAKLRVRFGSADHRRSSCFEMSSQRRECSSPNYRDRTYSWNPSSFPPQVKYLMNILSAHLHSALLLLNLPQTQLLGNGSTTLIQLEDLEHSSAPCLFPNLPRTIHHRYRFVGIHLAEMVDELLHAHSVPLDLWVGESKGVIGRNIVMTAGRCGATTIRHGQSPTSSGSRSIFATCLSDEAFVPEQRTQDDQVWFATRI